VIDAARRLAATTIVSITEPMTRGARELAGEPLAGVRAAAV
jgi:hypothetical protein